MKVARPRVGKPNVFLPKFLTLYAQEVSAALVENNSLAENVTP